jgi:hypothetical protein
MNVKDNLNDLLVHIERSSSNMPERDFSIVATHLTN